LERLLAARHLGLEVSAEARQFLAEQGYDPVFGARPLKRAIQRLLQNPIALEVLEGHYHPGDVIRVDRQGDGLRFSRLSGVAEPVSA
jgi:ATP-dependent Clp protease ATP-binding subunit ClpB